MKVFVMVALLMLGALPVWSQGFGRVPINKRDTLKYRRPLRCYPMSDQTYIGLDYGAIAQVFGIKASNWYPWAFGVPLSLAPDLTWRVSRNGNAYFNFELTRRDLLMRGKLSLAPRLGYKRIASNGKATDQFYTGLGLWDWHHGITLSYARQYQPPGEPNATNDNGIMLQVYCDFFNHLEVKLSAIYWFEQLQYSLAIREELFQSRFYIGAGYEKIAAWEEIDVSLALGF